MKPKPNAEVLPSLLEAIRGQLSPTAAPLLVRAFETKQISTTEISELLLPDSRTGKKFATAIKAFTGIFRQYGVRVTFAALGKPAEKLKMTPKPTVTASEPKAEVIPFVPEVSVTAEVMKKRGPGRPRKDSTLAQTITESSEAADDDTVDEELDETEEEEVKLEELLSRERLGDGFVWYMKKAAQHRTLQREELCTLVLLAKQGDLTARNTIITHNLRLVVKNAYKFIGRGLDLLDLIQEGNLGLLPAIEKFDTTMGFQFSTYATWWIKQYQRRALVNQAKLVRYPSHIEESLVKLRRIANVLFSELGREPTDEEVVARSKAIANATHLIVLLGYGTDSFDDILIPEGDNQRTRAETFADVQAVLPTTALEAKEELKQSQLDVMKLVCLVQELPYSDRDKRAFFMYYGLNGEKEGHTLESVGAEFGITRERIRQLVGNCWTALNRIGTPLTEVELMQELVSIPQLEKLAHRQ